MSNESMFSSPGRALRERVNRLGSPPVSEREPGEDSGQPSDGSQGGGGKHLLFVWKPSGYELAARDGEPPSVGEDVEHGEQRFRVSKVGPSPLPGDDRVCAYLQA